MTTPVELGSVALFPTAKPALLSRLAPTLETADHEAGHVLMSQGDPGSTFVILLNGVVTVARNDSSGLHDLGSVPRGSILGEMAVLTRARRSATVTAATSVRVAVGGEAALKVILETPAMRERLMSIAAPRFASVADRVAVTISDGGQFWVRPLAPTDRLQLAEALARQSQESLYHRFFTPGGPSSQTIDYLVNINYVDHFAWGVSNDGGRVVAEARYIRRRDEPGVADIALYVFDSFQGHGLGTLLLGALAMAAPNAGIGRFIADVLYENRAMLAVLSKAKARLWHSDRGVVTGSVDVSLAQRLIPEALRSELERTSRPVVTAAGLAPQALAKRRWLDEEDAIAAIQRYYNNGAS